MARIKRNIERFNRNTDALSGANESDALKRINRKKGFSPNSNQDSNQDEEQSRPVFVRGSDSVPPEQDVVDEAPKVEVKETAKRETKKDTSTQSTQTLVAPILQSNGDGTIQISEQLYRDSLAKAQQKAAAEAEAKLAKYQDTLAKEQDEKDKLKDKYERKLDEMVQQLNKERSQQNSLTRILTDFGLDPTTDFVGSTPQTGGQDRFIPPSSPNAGMSPRDAMRGYEKILSDASMQLREVRTATGVYVQRNTRALDQFVVKNRDAIREAMQDLAKKSGILGGKVRSGSFSDNDAVTTFANFPVPLREYLSQIVRIEHSARFVLWQFVNRNINTGVPVGQTTLVPRVKHLNAGTTYADWELTPGVPTVATRQNLAGNNISCVIKEWGMGKDATVEPVALADIVTQTNLLDIESLLRDRIGYNYHLWEDTIINALLLSSTATVYNNADGVVAAAGSVVSGGTITLNFLGALRAYMATRRVPTFPDGSYVFVGTPDHIAQIESDMQLYHSYTSPGDIEPLVNMFVSKTRNEYSGRMSGYKGKIRGFHVYESTSISAGAAGTPGVQTEAFGLSRTAFAMGADAVGWSDALPMEIREDPDTNFGRIQSLIWKCHSGVTGLDIDPARTILPFEVTRPVGGEEQLRVFKVNAAMAKVTP